MMDRVSNRELISQANDDVLEGTETLYEGPEGVILTASSAHSIEYWENETGADCSTPDSPYNPVLFYLPFTDDPLFNRQSIIEWNNGRLADDFNFDNKSDPDRHTFLDLQDAAIKSGAHVSIALFQSGLLSSEFPEQSWKQPEFMEHSMDCWPHSLNYMPEKCVTPELFLKGMKRSFDGWGMQRGVHDIINETPERFINLLSQEQWQEAEKLVPGLVAIIDSYRRPSRFTSNSVPTQKPTLSIS